MTAGYVDGSIRAFLDKLATSSPEPGGGSVAAMSGALGAGLVSMVASLTVGKEKYAGVQEEIQSLLAASEQVRSDLQVLVQRDTEVYGAVSEAMKLPRDTEQQKAERDKKMQAALKEAAKVPLTIAEQSLKVAELSLTAADIGNVNAVSDAGVAVLLADAAAQSAALNVKINIGWISDEEFNRSAWRRVEEILAATAGLRERVMTTTYEKLG
ncbi:MAG: cyclodeaminase/cyclohydrolase family protein [Thermoleophilia bacterium]|nr:cyclodeaminase/cyclohydrolase family protein [Thermoleophilia bacterium]